jgi:hypothetical protein
MTMFTFDVVSYWKVFILSNLILCNAYMKKVAL